MTGKLSRENLVYSIEMTSIPLCMVQLSILKIVFLALNQTFYVISQTASTPHLIHN